MSKKKYRVLLIEQSEALAIGIKSIVESTGEFCIIDTIGTLPDNAMTGGNADVLIANPATEGFSSLERIKSAHNGLLKVVILAHEKYPDRITGAFDAVISIYDSRTTVLKKLRSVMDNQTAQEGNSCELSAREKEILAAVASGLTNKEIAEKYFISVNTVVTHRRNITSKLGINTISGLTVYAVIHGLLDI